MHYDGHDQTGQERQLAYDSNGSSDAERVGKDSGEQRAYNVTAVSPESKDIHSRSSPGWMGDIRPSRDQSRVYHRRTESQKNCGH